MIEDFGDQIDYITLTKATEGRFSVEVNGKQVFSKKDAGRHANPGEVADNIRHYLSGGRVAV